MIRERLAFGAAAVLVAALLAGTAAPVSAQTALQGKNLSALARENLDKPRPKAPVDFTGTWNMVISQATGGANFLPLPKLTPKAEASVKTAQEWQAKGYVWRDDSGACWPLGMPFMMTRFWPIQIIQLPTMVQLTTMFNNDVRWIFMDGRGHPAEDEMVLTYNGHSIGRWEGNTLVIETVGMTDDHHWTGGKVPASTQLRVVERWKMIEDGKAMEIEFRMTDPEHWEGEWVNTKRYNREDRADIEEHVCIYEQVKRLPSFKYNIRN